MSGPRLLSALLLLAVLPGCSFYARNSIRGIWADCNSFGDPALILEKRDHLPYHRSRVHHYRWMYDMGPVLPTAPLPPRPPIKVGLLDGVCDRDEPCPATSAPAALKPPCAAAPEVVPEISVIHPVSGVTSSAGSDDRPQSPERECVQYANVAATIAPIITAAAPLADSEKPKRSSTGAWLFTRP